MKPRKLLSLIGNTVAVLFAIAGIVLIRGLQAVYFIKYFTLITASLIIVSGVISIGYSIEDLTKKNQEHIVPDVVFALRLITAVGAMITFLTVVCYLQYSAYSTFGPNTLEFWQNITLHYGAPLAFIASFIFFDLDKKYSFKLSFFGIVVLLIYMAYAIPLSNTNPSWWGESPYVFLVMSNVKGWMFLLLPGFVVGGLAISIILWLLNRICYLIFIGEEIDSNEEEDEEEKEAETKVEVTPEDESLVHEVIKTGYTGPRIYHISRRDDKMWQVKFATGKKAIKLFNTQAEAIVFAKKLAKSQEGSIRVHSLKGRIRKAH